MARYSDTATLVALTMTQNDEGSAVESRVTTEVFCNPYTVGMQTWAAARSEGLHADAQIELRTCDYSAQPVVILGKSEYEVERVEGKGEFTRLTLKRRLSNE